MKIVRGMAMAAVVAGVIVSLNLFAVMPFYCNVVLKDIRIATVDAAAMDDAIAAARVARDNVETLAECAEASCRATNFYMAKAANYRLLGRTSDAIDVYERALDYDRRPEIYLNLGVTALERGDEVKAREALLQACMFNPALSTYAIPVGEVRTDIIRQVTERDARIRQQSTR